jgi:hypothetical protein
MRAFSLQVGDENLVVVPVFILVSIVVIAVVIMMTPVPAVPIVLIRMTIMAVVPVMFPVIVGRVRLISRVYVNSKVVRF